MKRLLLASLMGTAISLATQAMANDVDIKSLEQAARTEGAVNSVGMPDRYHGCHPGIMKWRSASWYCTKFPKPPIWSDP